MKNSAVLAMLERQYKNSDHHVRDVDFLYSEPTIVDGKQATKEVYGYSIYKPYEVTQFILEIVEIEVSKTVIED